jgi:Methyltransferase domain
MNFANYVKAVSFRILKPNFYIRGFSHIDKLLMRTTGVSLEAFNTRLPFDEKPIRRRIVSLLRIPKMSTFAIGAMINRGVSDLDADCSFVNVGVWQGFSFLAGLVGNEDKKCIGIDCFSEFGGPKEQFLGRFNSHKGPNHYFYDLDYREYFSRVHSGKIGFYIYDGEHSYENQLAGLRIAEPFFSDDCIILVDDTNLEAARKGTLDFVKQSRNTYDVLLDKQTCINMHPTLWDGVMILQRRK